MDVLTGVINSDLKKKKVPLMKLFTHIWTEVDANCNLSTEACLRHFEIMRLFQLLRRF